MSDKLYYDQLLDFYEELLSQSQQEMVKYYYRQDLSLQEISELEGVSRSAIYDRLKRIRLELDHLEKVLGLYQKKEKRNQILTQIKGRVDLEVWEKLTQLED
ncbi:sigma factor-like helix-turn-helix DNA-binding protein [Bulleidia extructa]